MADTTDKIEQLQKKQALLQKKIARKKKAVKDTNRKEDTRRKIIAGALALTHMDTEPGSEFAYTMHKLLDRYVTRNEDRELFALPPLPEDQEEKN